MKGEWKSIFGKSALIVMLSFTANGLGPAYAQGEKDFVVSLDPAARYSFVKGDEEKFRVHHWAKENFVGGVQDFSLKKENLAGDLSLFMEGHALVDENDLKGSLRLDRGELGFIRFDYEEFSRFYEGTGGVYRRFNALRVNELEEELELEIGRLAVEAVLTFENFPELGFLYERRFKDGAKSRLTWSSVEEYVTEQSTTAFFAKMIGPSWQDIDEATDSVTLRLRHNVHGFEVKGKQIWKWMSSDTVRHEENLSSTGFGGVSTNVLTQNQDTDTFSMITLWEAERWFREDRLFGGAAYKFSWLKNKQLETIGNIINDPGGFGTHKLVDAAAHNRYESHTWEANTMFVPWPLWKVIAKVKSGLMKRRGFSTYPMSAAGSSESIGRMEESQVENQVNRLGEGVSLRFTGIPGVALYSDVELEQVRNWIMEGRQSLDGTSFGNPDATFDRETVADSWRGVWTAGAGFSPWRVLDVTTQLRHHRNQTDYDDVRESEDVRGDYSWGRLARSAFIDSTDIATNDLSVRVTYKLWRRFRPSFRYQWRADEIETDVENLDAVQTESVSHIYTAAISSELSKQFFLTTSFSIQTARTWVPADSTRTKPNGASVPIQFVVPPFDADVYTWLLDCDYVLKENLTFVGSFRYSAADNFNDFEFLRVTFFGGFYGIGLPLGASYKQADVSLGLRWLPKENWTVEPRYGLYHYDANEAVETGDYTAHVVSFQVSSKWG